MKKIQKLLLLVLTTLIVSCSGTLSLINGASDGIAWAATSTTKFTSVSKAAAYVRTAMKNRQETITLTITSTDSDYINVSRSIMSQALSHTGNSTEGDYLKYQYSGYHADISYTKFFNQYTYTITYSVTYYTTKTQESELTEALNQVMGSLKLDGKSNYEKIKIIYDYVCANVTYDYENLNDDSYKLKCTAYAALMNHTAICQGYSNLLYRMLLEAGIDCRIISGNANGGPHSWNIVRLGTKYYNLDATWDATYYSNGLTYQYFLKSDANFTDHTRDTDYVLTSFYASYPMADTDYDVQNPEPDISLKDCTIKLSSSSYTYNGKAKKPTVTVTYNNQTLKENVDYTVSYKNNVNAGTKASVIIAGKSGSICVGSVTKKFTIKKAANTITASNIKKTISGKKRTISLGVKRNGKAKLTYKSSNSKIKVASDGQVTIPAKFVGKATITITAAATTNYKKATKKITISVTMSGTRFTKITSGLVGKMKFKWKRNNLASGYMIQCATTSDFKTGLVTKKITGNKTTSTTVTGLKQGKSYYVRIRTFRKSGGKVYYSKWYTY